MKHLRRHALPVMVALVTMAGGCTHKARHAAACRHKAHKLGAFLLAMDHDAEPFYLDRDIELPTRDTPKTAMPMAPVVTANADEIVFEGCSTRSGYGVVNNDWDFPSDALDMENNILYATSGGTYAGGSVGMHSGIGTVTNDLFYNGVDGDSWDSHPVSGDPLFVSLTTPDAHLQTGSPAIGAGSTAVSSIVTSDYDLNPRSPSSIDIGAYVH